MTTPTIQDAVSQSETLDDTVHTLAGAPTRTQQIADLTAQLAQANTDKTALSTKLTNLGHDVDQLLADAQKAEADK